MKILKMTMTIDDNDLYHTEIIAEHEKKSFACVMKISEDFLLDGIFGQAVNDALLGQYNHLLKKRPRKTL